jgi:hypothetical protein
MDAENRRELGKSKLLGGDIVRVKVLLRVPSINPEYEAEINSRSSQ